jgi:hypothetical protein
VEQPTGEASGARRKRRFAPWIFAVAIVNFVTFMAVAMSLGGDACNGTVEDGRYFLSSHGRRTEVSAGVYAYSLCHTTSVFITHIAALIAAINLRASRRRE